MVNVLRYFILLLVGISTSYAQNCDTVAITEQRENLGLYGGLAGDLTYSNVTKRLFAVGIQPSSLMYTDDSCKTWHQAFPYDSLEYECGERGWGGGGAKVIANNVGWVMVQTYQAGTGNLMASIISFQNGDSGSYRTLIDSYKLKNLGYSDEDIFDIGLSDYYAYTLMGPYIIRENDKGFNSTQDIMDMRSAITGLPNTANAIKIAIANSVSGFPYYIIVDTIGDSGSAGQLLYKYDGSAFSSVNLPLGVSTINRVHTHPAQPLGDTLFISAEKGALMKYYRSYDGGTSWTDITPIGVFLPLEVDYSKEWIAQYPQANGLILMASGKAISKDLGINWEYIPLSSGIMTDGMAIHPQNCNYIVACNTQEIAIGTQGVLSTFSGAENYGYAAVQVLKIARSTHKGVFYLPTMSGLAYTSAYLDQSVSPYNKWNSPYGSFPISGMTQNYTAVAIDPADSLHVIAGFSNIAFAGGFSVTTTGPTGFSTVIPTNISKDSKITDIAFITSSLVLATTTGSQMNNTIAGHIWRSVDGGISWSDVSPLGFSSGNTIGVGYGVNDTVIYIGTGMKAIDPGCIWKSADGGLSWLKVNDGPISITDSNIQKLPIWDIAVDPRGTDTLYIGAGMNDLLNNITNKIDQAFVKSTDGGKTYQYLNVEGESEFNVVVIDPSNPDTNVYVANNRSIYQLVPALNDTIIQLFKGMPNELIPDICIGSVLAGTTTGFYGIEQKSIKKVVTSLGNEAYDHRNIHIYPNPTNDKINIELAEIGNGLGGIKLQDVSGRVLLEENNISLSTRNHYEFSVKDFEVGIYFLMLRINDKSYCQKIMVVR